MKILILADDEAVKGYAFPIAVNIYESGSQLTPVSGTITIKDPGGTKIVSSAAMTLATKTLTYSLAASYLTELWENAVIEIDYIITSTHYRATFLFDCVLNKLEPCVIDDDLKKYEPLLANQIWSTQTDYSKQIEEAFKLVKRGIKDKGKRPSMIIDGSQVRELVILKTFEIISFNFARDKGDVWWARYEKYRDQYTTVFSALNIKYDVDESGTIEEDEKKTLGQVTFQR